jgi:hypothetical protein
MHSKKVYLVTICFALGLVAAVTGFVSTCHQSAGMVAPPGTPNGGPLCECEGYQITLEDQRPVDGDVVFLCIGRSKEVYTQDKGNV